MSLIQTRGAFLAWLELQDLDPALFSPKQGLEFSPNRPCPVPYGP